MKEAFKTVFLNSNHFTWKNAILHVHRKRIEFFNWNSWFKSKFFKQSTAWLSVKYQWAVLFALIITKIHSTTSPLMQVKWFTKKVELWKFRNIDTQQESGLVDVHHTNEWISTNENVTHRNWTLLHDYDVMDFFLRHQRQCSENIFAKHDQLRDQDEFLQNSFGVFIT